MLKTIVLILLAIWLIGLLADIVGGIIHIILLVALAVFVYDMFKKRGSS